MPKLCEGDVLSDWGVLSKCICVFFSYTCAARWIGCVFHDEGGDLGWNSSTACRYTQRRTLCGLETVGIGVCCARLPGGVCLGEDESDVLFLNLYDVLFEVTGRCVC